MFRNMKWMNLSSMPKGKILLSAGVVAASSLFAAHQYDMWANHNTTQILRYGDDSIMNGILSRCSTLTSEPFTPNFFLSNLHAQTVFNALFRQSVDDNTLPITRKCYTFKDGTSVYLDWIEAIDEQDRINIKPRATLFIVPGVVSGTDGVGVKHIVVRAIKCGYRCVVFNYLSEDELHKNHKCIIPGGTCRTKDFTTVIKSVKRDIGNDCPLIAVGISLGANILANYLGSVVGKGCPPVDNPLPLLYDGDVPQDVVIHDVDEEQVLAKAKQPDHKVNDFSSAILIANPYRLALATRNLHKSKVHRTLYDNTFIPRRKQLFAKNVDVLLPMYMERRGISDVEAARKELLEKIWSCETTREMDRDLTMPLHERNFNVKYKNVDEFYETESCENCIDKIQIPTICVNATDDPISPSEVIPSIFEKVIESKNPNVVFVVTKKGGHSGWVDGILPYWGPTWIERSVIQCLDAMMVVNGNKNKSLA
ncbi:hypothetical protein AKO1_013615 [Acrasis kona]|uniref:Uncharacterized protein n=1 Tax=Acrasis kona TaxID=1008807 RepID=A0AAW2YVZ6_9EUKA